MKNTFCKSIGFTALVSLATLSACGGGGDIAASPSTFSVFPSAASFASLVPGDAYCEHGGGASTVVNIVGGTPPYRIINTAPDYMIVDKSVAEGKNPQFTVVARNACSSKSQVLILDYHSNSTTFSLTVTAGPAATATTP